MFPPKNVPQAAIQEQLNAISPHYMVLATYMNQAMVKCLVMEHIYLTLNFFKKNLVFR
jgi:ABC-type Fe3+-citrate transport system substrate-binding protein